MPAPVKFVSVPEVHDHSVGVEGSLLLLPLLKRGGATGGVSCAGVTGGIEVVTATDGVGVTGAGTGVGGLVATGGNALGSKEVMSTT